MPAATTITHLLFDVDGVLFDSGGRELPVAVDLVGEQRVEAFLTQLSTVGLPSLTGQGTFRDALAPVLPEYGITRSARDVEMALLGTSTVVPASLELVARLRAAGYGVHLGTNQDSARATLLRTAAGFDELFDVSCYSCEMGVAKPDPAFFDAAVDMIGAAAGEVLFIDDRSENVDGARQAGLPAEQWHVREGHPALLELLAEHGIRL